VRYLSLFSGIEAASVAWEPLGWEPVAFADPAPFPSAVLAHRFPTVPNLGDITAITDWTPYAGVDVLVGGSPCQAFSVAGLRKGLADPRGNLALEYLRAVDAVRPRWVVWENVPGVLSVDGGRAFGAFLGGLAELGYGFAYRVMDAQYVRVQSHARAVPQRRRRVFVVGCAGADWQRAAAVLLERESLRGHPAPVREQGAGVAGTLEARAGTGGYDCGASGAAAGHLIPEVVTFADVSRKNKRQNGPGFSDSGVAFTLTAGDQPGICEAVAVALRGREDGADIEVGDDCSFARRASQGGGDKMLVMAQGGANAEITEGFSPTLTTVHDGPPIVMAPAFSKRPGQQIATRDDGSSFALTTGEPPRLTCGDYAVRRLTPLECERLQGFPDGWTDVPWRGKAHAGDGVRYHAIGNSMAVNVMRWIGERIAAVNAA